MEEKKKQKKEPLLSKPLEGYNKEHSDFEYPKVSVVIPTYNCAQIIDITLESVLTQDYPNYEVIIIDAGSTDKTLEVIKGYREDKIRIYSVSGFNRYEMLNKGITQAKGDYLNFLFPGDFYVSSEAYKIMMELVLAHETPHLVFCGALLRDGRNEVKILFRHLTAKLLRRGQQPTTLQSCWFYSALFKELGKFDITLSLRGGFDLLCRYNQHRGFRTVSTNRVLMDYDLRMVSRAMVLTHFFETWKIILKYFGFFYACRFLMIQKDVGRFIKLWWRSFMLAFIRRKS